MSQAPNIPTTTTQETSNANPAPTTQSAPTEYTPFTAPEGSTLDPKAIEGATAIFRELGLDQSQAQKLIDWGAKREVEAGTKGAEAYNQMRLDWRSQAEADLNANYAGGVEQAKSDIAKAIATLPPKLQTEFKDAMTLTGAGDNPAIIKGFLQFVKGVIEGQHVSGNGPSTLGQTNPATPARPSAAQSMFPTLPSSTPH